MKKISVILALCLFIFTLSAHAEGASQPLSLAEITDFNQAILKLAIADGLEPLPVEGGFLAQGVCYELLLDKAELDENARVLSAAITGIDDEVATVPGPRGTVLDMKAEDLLRLFQNDNEFLAGTREGAALYIAGELPAAVLTGFVLRDGQRLLLAEYNVYTQADQGISNAGMQFTLEEGTVSAIRSFLSPEALSQDEARGEIQKLEALQEENAYIAYPSQESAQLTREDMVVAGLDFFDLTQEGAKAVFGDAANREVSENSDGSQFITLQWPDVEAVFEQSGDLVQALRISLTGSLAEGPRGLRIGDTLAQVISRFEHGEDLPQDGGALYGDAEGQVPPYAAMVKNGDGVMLYYVIQAEERNAALILTFMEDRLVDMTLAYL